MPHLCHWLMFCCLSQSYMISHPGNSALQYVSRKLQRPKIQASQWHSYETNDYDSVLKHIYKDSNCIAVQINNLCCQVTAVSDASTLPKKKKKHASALCNTASTASIWKAKNTAVLWWVFDKYQGLHRSHMLTRLFSGLMSSHLFYLLELGFRDVDRTRTTWRCPREKQPWLGIHCTQMLELEVGIVAQSNTN